MRTWIAWLFIPLLSAAFAAVAETGEWGQANELYQKGQYGQAVDVYQSLLKKAPGNPYLHYNLANAYFKQGANASLGLAIVEYLRAYQLLPRDPDIRYNLDFALKRGGESLVPNGIPEAMHDAFYFLSESELLGFLWIGWWASLLLGSAYLLLGEKFRSKLRPWIWVSLLLLVSSGSWCGLRRMADIPNLGVTLEASTEARSGPGSNFSVSFNAPEGRRVSILSQEGDWVEINMIKEALQGWVPAKAVERVNAI